MSSKNETKKRFMQLTEPWWHRLYNIALRHTGERTAAEDWTQEALLRAWKDFHQLQEGVAVYAWLLKILDRVIADDKRRSARRTKIAPMVVVNNDDLTAHPCSAPGPFSKALAKQNHAQLTKVIQQLPDEFRGVIILRDLEGLSYAEISSSLDIAKGTVMSRLSRGRRLLASIILESQSQHSEHSQQTSRHSPTD